MKHLLYLLLVVCISCGADKGTEPDEDTAALPDTLPDTAPELPAAPDTVEVRADTAEVFSCRHPVPARVVDDNRDETFDLGPYLMATTDTEVSVMWRTLEAEDGAVLYGLESPDEHEVPHNGVRFIHKVRLKKLLPGTRYAYRVRSGERTSDVHHFYTAPPAGGSFQFAAWGDNQGGEPFPDVLAAVLADQPHLLLGLGDHVGNGKIDEQWKDQLFDPGRALFHEVPFFAAFGNHGKNGPLYYDLMGFEDLEHAPDGESVFSYTWGNAFFLVVDTNGLFFPIGDIESPWSEWIRQQVAGPRAQEATWRIAYAHEPGATIDDSIGPLCNGDVNDGVRAFLLPLLNEHGFHAYLCGHTHLYERSTVDDVVHVISGGGGGGLEVCELESEVSAVADRHHFLRGTVGCDSLRIEAVGLDGQVFDWVELAPGAPGDIIDQGPLGNLP